jgi:hypothetical protein
MNQLQTQPAPAGVRRSADVLRVVVIAVLALAALYASLRLVEGPSFVSRVTVVNRSALDLDVDAAGSEHDGWTPAGVATHDSNTSFVDVLDHGDRWWFRVSEGGHSVAFPISRSRLAADGWRVVIPPTVETQLASRGGTGG